MFIAVTILAAVAVVIGLIGIVVPVLPGLLLVASAVVVWALVAQHAVGWAVLVVSIALALAGWVLEYIVPARQMQAYGVPRHTLLTGAVAGVVGLILLPPLGLPLGFVVGVFASEYVRLRSVEQAWPSAVQALKAALISYGIELSTAVLIAVAFAIGVIAILGGAGQPVAGV